jgi:hypothetical protein
MGIHDRAWLGRAIERVCQRAARRTDRIDGDPQEPDHLSWWLPLVIGSGAVATLLWVLIVGWYVVRLGADLIGWLSG